MAIIVEGKEKMMITLIIKEVKLEPKTCPDSHSYTKMASRSCVHRTIKYGQKRDRGFLGYLKKDNYRQKAKLV
ncbi:hypothetical protein KBI33_02185 [Candidatus Shapirobacteria bacterium]|nr:hypothetical protein [Candidatus Shapirobacteria bacterium]